MPSPRWAVAPPIGHACIGDASIGHPLLPHPPAYGAGTDHQNAAYSAIRMPITPTAPALNDALVA